MHTQSPARAGVNPIADLVLIYRDAEDVLHEQPATDLTDVGTLIDPETGDDMAPVGWRIQHEHIELGHVDLEQLPAGSVVTATFFLEGTTAEKSIDGLWLLAGAAGLQTAEDIAELARTPITLLRRGGRGRG